MKLNPFFKKGAYFFIDAITLGKGVPVTISGFRIKFPARVYRYFPKNYEETGFNFLRKYLRPGMVSIDIGAHFGLYSVFLQKQTNGTVYAFEPTPSTLQILRETLKLNHCTDSVHVIPAAVDEKPGKAVFFIHNVPGSVANSLVDPHSDEFPETGYEVNVASIDQFVKERNIKIDFIKIDAEGAELGVLRGGWNTIRENKPLINLAMHPNSIANRGNTNEQIWDFLAPMNYKILFKGEPIEKSTFCSKTDLFDVHLIPS